VGLYSIVLSFDNNNSINKVVVAPEVEGTVTSITSTVTVGSGSSATQLPAIAVSGVLIVANTDPSQGPVTAYGNGYTGWSNIQVGDNDEIHGLLRSANGWIISRRPSMIESAGGAGYLLVTTRP